MEHKALAMNMYGDKFPVVSCERLPALAVDDVPTTDSLLKKHLNVNNQPHVRLIFWTACACEVIEIMRAFVDRQQLVQLCYSLRRHSVSVIDCL